MKKITFKIAAYTDRGGRPDKNNEDNFVVDFDLGDNEWIWPQNIEYTLPEKGALMVVSDGMGGMNAGDVASEIAVNTVKEFFVSEKITEAVLKSETSILKFIETVIVEADKRIKTEGNSDRDKEGMGATIVIAWILNGKAYIGWCGDSRAYLFNPNCGLKQVSKDHSYVQELVDNGLLKPELAFDHPNSNIITRSLGEPNQKANPDFVTVDLCNDDIMMICSDGLCGVLRDNEMEAIIAQNSDNMQKCREALFEAAKNADWTDNTTVTLCKIVSGCPQRPVAKKPLNNDGIKNTKDEFTKSKFEKLNNKLKLKNYIVYLLLLLLLCAVGYWLWTINFFTKDFWSKNETTLTVNPQKCVFDKDTTLNITVSSKKSSSWNFEIDNSSIDIKKKDDSTLQIKASQNEKEQTTSLRIMNKYDTVKIEVTIKAKKEQSDNDVDKNDKQSEPKSIDKTRGKTGNKGHSVTDNLNITESKDQQMYKECKTVDDYRKYVSKYPRGEFYKSANDSIQKFVKDSTDQANRAAAAKKAAEEQRIAEENRKAQEKAAQGHEVNKSDSAGQGNVPASDDTNSLKN